jgi:hypothetical protein
VAALTKDRNTAAKSTERLIALKAAAGARLYLGALISVNPAGFAVPAENSGNQRFIGVAQESLDNTTGADGEKRLRVQKGVFRFANSTVNPIAQEHIGAVAFVEDDQTVAHDGSLRAGVVDSLDESGQVWIFIA